jgi:hypothetical protein
METCVSIEYDEKNTFGFGITKLEKVDQHETFVYSTTMMIDFGGWLNFKNKTILKKTAISYSNNNNKSILKNLEIFKK